MLEKALSTHESYKDSVELENGNYILYAYQIYMVWMKCYYLCTSLFIARGKYTQPHGFLVSWKQLNYYHRVELNMSKYLGQW